MTRVEDRNTADMAAQFTQIAMTGKRTPGRTISASIEQRQVFLTSYLPGSLKLFWNFRGKPLPVLPKTVDLCLEMSSDLKYNFCFVVEEIFELGNATKYR